MERFTFHRVTFKVERTTFTVAFIIRKEPLLPSSGFLNGKNHFYLNSGFRYIRKNHSPSSGFLNGKNHFYLSSGFLNGKNHYYPAVAFLMERTTFTLAVAFLMERTTFTLTVAFVISKESLAQLAWQAHLKRFSEKHSLLYTLQNTVFYTQILYWIYVLRYLLCHTATNV